MHIVSPYFCKSFPPIFAKTSGYYLKSFVIRDFDLWLPVFIIELPRHFFFLICITPQRQTEPSISFSSLSLSCRFRAPSLMSDGQSGALRASLLWWLEGKFPFWCVLFGTSVSCFSGIWRDHVIRWQEAGKICCNKNALKKKKTHLFLFIASQSVAEGRKWSYNRRWHGRSEWMTGVA